MAPEDDNLRLPAKLLHQIICRALEEALEPRSSVPTDDDGYVGFEVLLDYILECQNKIVLRKDWNAYTTNYKPTEMIRKGINPILAQIGKQIDINTKVRPFSFKGYKGVLNDYMLCTTMHNNNPLDKDTFNFIKGTLDFDTMAAIRNRIRDITDKAWNEYCILHPKHSANKTIEKEIRNRHKPDGPFVCFEGSVYEFTPEYNAMTERERDLLLKFADAIIYQKVVEVSYQAFHYNRPDSLEFHPHYIRKVGNKLMVYGRSRSIRYHRPDQYTLVNLIVQRVQEVRDFPGDKHYYSAKELGLDYNNGLFRDRMTFNAPGYNQEHNECTEVILKVRKEVPTLTNPRRPYDRLRTEPLHHSQKVFAGISEDNEFGYLSLYITDYMFIRPILLSWGSDIQVVAPQDLKQQMQAEIARMAGMYGLLHQQDNQCKFN